MDKDNYNIDNILSELKQRKEKEKIAAYEKTVEEEQKLNITVRPKQEEAPEIEEAPAAEDTPSAEVMAELEAIPATEEDALPDDIPVASAHSFSEEETPEAEELPEVEETPEAEELPEGEELPEVEETPEAEKAPAEEEAPAEGMVNLFELAGDPASEDEEAAEDEAEAEEELPDAPARKRPPRSKARKILTAIIAVLLALLIAAGALFAWVNNELNILKKNNDETTVETTEEWQGMKKLVENFDPINETEATELSSLEDMIKTWYYNGTPCSSTHVLNVLLIGEDTRGSKIKAAGTRADSAIIASVNIDTKKITLVSVLRDAWAYWETDRGDESSGEFGKINGAMSTGNVRAYMRTIENLYKIKLDGYAIVNFTSFVKIIKVLGGVTLELTEEEIDEINNHPKRYGDVYIEKTFEGKKGKMKLNGRQALAYCRIRHIDTDNARADRQKTTLIALFNQSKDASTGKMIRITQALIPYIRTSFSKNEIVKIARYAISKNWVDYGVEMTNIPDYNLRGGNFKPEYLSQWIWKADFPADAYFLQTRLYGRSSITLAKLRVDTKKVKQSGFRKDGARATYDTVKNNHYGESTTLPPTTNEDEEESTTKA